MRALLPIPAAPNPPVADVYLSQSVDLFSFDAEYLRRLQTHDPATEAHFSHYFTRRLNLKLRHRGFHSPVLDDIRQDTFLRVINAVQRGDVQQPERFGAFVAAVCDHLILETYRDSARNQQNLDVESMEFPDNRVNLESQMLRKEKREIVAAILEEMPSKKRDILRALLNEDLDRDEVCERFQVKSDYLRVLLFRAKEEFAARLKDKGWNAPGDCGKAPIRQ